MSEMVGRGVVAAGAGVVCAAAGARLATASSNGERVAYGAITLVAGFEVIGAAVLGRWTFADGGTRRSRPRHRITVIGVDRRRDRRPVRSR